MRHDDWHYGRIPIVLPDLNDSGLQKHCLCAWLLHLELYYRPALLALQVGQKQRLQIGNCHAAGSCLILEVANVDLRKACVQQSTADRAV